MTSRPVKTRRTGRVYCGNTYGQSACTLHHHNLSPHDEDLGPHIRDIRRVSDSNYATLLSQMETTRHAPSAITCQTDLTGWLTVPVPP